jgi:hypothetical protein
MRAWPVALLVFALIPWILAAPLSAAPAKAGDADARPAEEKQSDLQEKRYDEFSQLMSGAKLIGYYTVVGKDLTDLSKEDYTITSATKLPQGDLWLLTARLNYGETDLTVPVPLQVKWAGDTPVITLTDLTIPGLGTFSSRVVIYRGRYAGTWTHGKVQGHLFGVVDRADEETAN